MERSPRGSVRSSIGIGNTDAGAAGGARRRWATGSEQQA